jgi:hypothetical protein
LEGSEEALKASKAAKSSSGSERERERETQKMSAMVESCCADIFPGKHWKIISRGETRRWSRCPLAVGRAVGRGPRGETDSRNAVVFDNRF